MDEVNTNLVEESHVAVRINHKGNAHTLAPGQLPLGQWLWWVVLWDIFLDLGLRWPCWKRGIVNSIRWPHAQDSRVHLGWVVRVGLRDSAFLHVNGCLVKACLVGSSHKRCQCWIPVNLVLNFRFSTTCKKESPCFSDGSPSMIKLVRVVGE